MSTAKFTLLGLFIFLIAPLHAARGETVSVVDWQTSGNPFARSESLGGLSIATAAELNRQTGARVNLAWSCVRNGTNLAIGISNGDLDYSPVNNKLPLQIRIDSGAIASFNIVPELPRRFVINEHLDPRALFANDAANIYKASYLYVGFPANGEDLALRINFQDSGVRQFITSCLATLQGHGEKKQVQTEIKHLQTELSQITLPAPAPMSVPVRAPVAQPVVIPVVATQPPISLSPPSQIEAREIPPVFDPSVEPTDNDPQSRSARWKELGKYNLDPGEEMVLRREYAPGSARIRIGALYKDIPHNDDERASLKAGDVNLGGDDAMGRNTALTIVDVHQSPDGLDDWYRVKVICTGCAADTAAPDGWVAASDVASWRDDPLCVLGTRGCD